MTAPNDRRLAFLRHTTAIQSTTYTVVELFEFISILDELIEKRDRPRYREIVELRADRVKLQGEIERLTHELAEAHATRPFPPDLVQRIDELPRDFEERKRTATDIEALAQRLAKVEDRLAAHSADINALKYPAFPTGAATTVADVIAQVEEPVAESEPLKPQRGDRVRLEGARSLGNTKLEDRGYDVTGATAQDFQVEAGIGRFWIVNDDPALKEVRRGAAKLPE